MAGFAGADIHLSHNRSFLADSIPGRPAAFDRSRLGVSLPHNADSPAAV